tara:strand:- start:1881 stop:2642 length:762 start_codon:yes stop_codon:yes gene_type:complete
MQSNVVFMTNIEDNTKLERSKPYKYSVKSWSKWCDKNNVQFFILDQYIFDTNYMIPNWYKLYVFELLENQEIDYDQIAIVDADTIVHPNCPNFFETSENKFCAVHNDGSYDWICRSMENYSKHVFDGFTFSIWEYINSGFIILNREHKQLYQNIIKFYFENKDLIINVQNTFGVGTDQPIINFFLQKENIDLKLLSYKFNMQDMANKEILDNDLTFTKLGWIYHYNAIPNNNDSSLTYYWMKKTYEELYDNIS